MRYTLIFLIFVSVFLQTKSISAQTSLGTVKLSPQVDLEISWNNVCAPNVAVFVVQNIVSQNKVWTAPLSSTAANSVLEFVKTPLLQACPQITHIGIFNHGKPQHFLALAEENWKIKQHRAKQIQSTVRIQTTNDDLLILSSDGEQVTGRFGQTPPVSDWIELEGRFIPEVRNARVLGGAITGDWFAYGSLENKCESSREGYAYWGQFELQIDLQGSITNAMRSDCKSGGNPDSSNKIKWFADIPSNTEQQRFVETGLKTLDVQQALDLYIARNASEDGTLAKEHFLYLHWLGFAHSRYLFSHDKVDYFVARAILASNNQQIVAMHKAADDEILLNGIEGPDGTVEQAFKFSETGFQSFTDNVINRVASSVDELGDLLTIYHYSYNPAMVDVSSKRFKTIDAMVSTSFIKQNGKWRQRFSRRNSAQQYYTLQNNQGLQFNKVYAKRSAIFQAEIERNRRDMLSSSQKAKEDAQALDEQDELWRTRAQQGGFVWRSWVYWKQFRFGEDYRAILNGTYEPKERAGIFPHLLLRFYGQYYISCSQNVPEGAPGYDYYTETTVSDGYFENEYSRFDGSVRIKPKYWPAFKYHHENAPDLGVEQAMKDSLSTMFFESAAEGVRQNLRNVQFYYDLLTTLNQDSEMLIENEGCDSGFVQQLEENFFRLSQDKPTVQEDTLNTDFAQNDKEKLFKTDLFESCLRVSGANSSASWCSCIDEEYAPLLNKSAISKYSGNFSQFRSDMTNANTPLPLIKAWNACLR